MGEARNRDRQNGQYAPEPGAVCVCGHVNHTAVKAGGKQPCIGHEFGECAEPCDCERYRPRTAEKTCTGKVHAAYMAGDRICGAPSGATLPIGRADVTCGRCRRMSGLPLLSTPSEKS